MDNQGFRELRCSNKQCGGKNGQAKLLGKSLMIPPSVLEIKCPRCGTVTQFTSAPITK